jgi:hypothetical protein
MSIKIGNEEKRFILEQHQSLKNELFNKKLGQSKVVVEQKVTSIGADMLERAKTECGNTLTNATFTSILSPSLTNNQRYAALVIRDPKNALHRKVYTTMDFGDGRYTVFTLTNDKQLVSKKPWTCDALTRPTVSSEDAQDIQNLITSQGYQKFEDLSKTLTRDEILELYSPHPKFKNLFKLKADSGKISGFTPQQVAFIKEWTGQTQGDETTSTQYKYNLTDEELASGVWTYFVVPGSEKRFPGGLKIYKKDEGVITKKQCRDDIEEYYNLWSSKIDNLSTMNFTRLKDRVQRCTNQHYGEFGMFGGKKLDGYLDVLSGSAEGGPASTSKWRIIPKGNNVGR